MVETNTKSQLIDINGLSVFKERMDASVDEKIAEIGQGVTYTLSKNDVGEIVLTGTDNSITKVTDENTTYTFTQKGTVLTITPSTGNAIEIQLGEDITSTKIIEALGYTPANKNDIPNVPTWAMSTEKPKYTANEVGALPNTTQIPTKVSDLSDDVMMIRIASNDTYEELEIL